MRSKLAAFVFAAALVGSMAGALASPRVVTDLVAFRSGPGVTFLPILVIPPDSVVDARRCHHGWCRVNYAGVSGFVASGLLAKPVVVEPVIAEPLIAEPVGVAVAPVAPIVTFAPTIVAEPVVAPVLLPPPPVGLITVPLPVVYY